MTTGVAFPMLGARFELVRRLGAGATGIVYEAFDRERGMPVALKTMRAPTPASLSRLKQELRALAGIAHPNLVALHELHAEGDAWFFAMELVDGVDPRTYVRRTPDRLRAMLAQIAQGIVALHDAGMSHRDIKPSNILVTSGGRAVVLDFGVTAAFGETDRAGTPAYMAPEQARGEASPASDWYAFGVVIYELLTGARPFQGSSRAILYDKCHYPPQSVLVRVPDAPADLAALTDALLRREPGERPAQEEILARLRVPARRRWPRGTERDGLVVGRGEALAVLRAGFADAERGRGTIVHVRGRSGVGKSTLLASFVREVEQDRGAVVLTGRCYCQDSVPYKAVDSLLDALARLLGELPRADADAVLPRDILWLAQLFPVLRGVAAVAQARRRGGPTPEPLELRRRAFAALRELIARLAEHRALALVIDDLQWGDLDSAALLVALMAPPDPPAILLVLASRAEDDAAPILQALRRPRERLGAAPPPLEISLEPLARGEACELAGALIGRGPEDPRSVAIADEAEGMPFLIHELAFARDAAPTIDQLIAARIGELAAAERMLIELIALAATPIARARLAQASALSPAAVEAGLAKLVVERLARVTPCATSYECYHDRIREAVAMTPAPERRRALHGRLAAVLADHEALVVHCEAAGDRAAAAEHALIAAAQASRALAFDRAANLYRTALRLGDLDAMATREVQIALGDALAHAGDGAAAGETYLSAATGAPADLALELRRRGASQLLRTGRIDDGLRVLETVLAEIGEQLPPTPRRALVSLAAQRIRLRLRGLAFTRRDEAQLSARDLVRIDTLGTASTDLAMVDTVTGAAFATREVRMALDLGEPRRIALALTTEAMFLAAQGRERRTSTVLARARAIVEELTDPELPAWVDAAEGLAAYQRGEFARAFALSEGCVHRLREDCTGVAWQVGGVEVQSTWSLFYLGRLGELLVRVDAAVEQARARGNRFDSANFGSGLPALAWAAVDRTAQGRVAVADAIAAWSPRGFHLQHYYSLLALASFDLYDGRAHAAAARVDAEWRALRGSRLLFCRSVAIEAHHLRARAAIAAGGPRAPVDAALRVMHGLRGNPWADAMAALLDAGQVADRDAAIEALEVARDRCARGELAAFAAAARRRRAELLLDPGELSAADASLVALGVRAPERFARMLVPIRAGAR